MTATTHKFTNELAKATSPYLLQHAHNPVQWRQWNDATIAEAKKANKLILVSIGYSACHWCHVMEHESFEDEQVAEIMNTHFINIKVDREERPDVDYIYMAAVQLMTGRGGWPLNCICLPDGRPLYGGTYFQKNQWKEVLLQLAEYFKREPLKCEEYATELTHGVNKTEGIVRINSDRILSKETLNTSFEKWSAQFDNENGGPHRAPKFPMPNNYEYLLFYAMAFKNEKSDAHLQLTLTKMYKGGIYDQLGGGFARYSTDLYWKVPHFEKMLYDNAQLIQLYAKAYACYGNAQYLKAVNETILFLQTEFCAPNGGYYTALDADSEGVEGKYYVWTEMELRDILQSDFETLSKYYEINDTGYWEHDNYILMRNNLLCEAGDVELLETIKSKLLLERNKRIKPGLDDKQLLSTNAQTVSALATAYIVTGNQAYLDSALRCMAFIEDNFLQHGSEHLFHTFTKGKADIDAFADDYASLIEAYIYLYHATFTKTYMDRASELMEYSMQHFFDAEQGLFYFTHHHSERLFARKFETQDNVTPASNSVFAKCLFVLGRYFSNNVYVALSKEMLAKVQSELEHYAPAFSNWSILQLWITNGYYDVVVYGRNAQEKSSPLKKLSMNNCIVIVDDKPNSTAHFENKTMSDDAEIYICDNEMCFAPATNTDEAFKLINTFPL